MVTDKQYQTYQPLLFSLAYRMLGNVMDAEDIVQEAFLSMNQASAGGEEIQNERAYLCKIVTNRCLNLLHSSAKQREVYVGTWLPEPLVQDEYFKQDPSDVYLQKESISTAYLLLLQQLNAVERAVFLLREIFLYPYNEIANIVGKSSSNCRQIFHRAKKNILNQPVNEIELNFSTTESRVQQFISSMLEGNIERLKDLLKHDVVHYSDGGGKTQAVRYPVMGITKVVQMYMEFSRQLNKSDKKYSYSVTCINGNIGCIFKIDNRIAYVSSFEIRNDKIQSVYTVANPDKLKHLTSISK